MPAEFREEIDAHFEHMPERYFQTYGVNDIAEHIRLFREFLEVQYDEARSPLAPVIKWVDHRNRGHSEFLFCGWDREELLSRIAGSLSVAQLNILGADVFTRTDNLVLDIFRVCNTQFESVTDEKDIALVEKRLRQSLEAEEFDFNPLIAKSLKKRGYQLSQELDFPTRIVIDNDAHPVYTLVDIQTPDRLGLLYRLLRAFAEANVYIVIDPVTTEKGAAIDAFYVSDAEGRKLRSATTIAKLQKALQSASQVGTAVWAGEKG